jgi:hypothetical protein
MRREARAGVPTRTRAPPQRVDGGQAEVLPGLLPPDWPEGNQRHALPGWRATTRRVRVELADGT